MPSELIVALQEANREIRVLVSKLSENSAGASNAALASGELEALSRKLARAGQLLGRVSPAQPEREAQQAALSEYAGNLETLKGVLGKFQESLGRQLDRLKKDFEQLNSARAWVKAFRATH
jgi:DNA repair exonuclease SbcCD ATPase subunit